MNQPHEDDELDRSLVELWRTADAGTRAPADFDARLFARLEHEAPRVTSAGAWSLPTLPWWVRAAGERHVALALALAGAIVAWPTLWSTFATTAGAFGSALAQQFGRTVTALLPGVFAPLMAPRFALITAVCLAGTLAWASYRLAFVAERWARHAALGRVLPTRRR